jgi:hypothetical protein
MADEKFLSLDDIVPETKEVTIGGNVYRLHADASVKTMLEMTRAIQKHNEDKTNLAALSDLLLTLKGFFIDPVNDDILLALTPTQAARLIGFIFGAKPGEIKNGNPSQANQ